MNEFHSLSLLSTAESKRHYFASFMTSLKKNRLVNEGKNPQKNFFLLQSIDVFLKQHIFRIGSVLKIKFKNNDNILINNN